MFLLLSARCNRKFARGKQVIKVKCHFSFVQNAHFQNLVQAIKSTNLQTHEPVNFKKPTKIETHENKVFHSNPSIGFAGNSIVM